jgi:hypothetical protein
MKKGLIPLGAQYLKIDWTKWHDLSPHRQTNGGQESMADKRYTRSQFIPESAFLFL